MIGMFAIVGLNSLNAQNMNTPENNMAGGNTTIGSKLKKLAWNTKVHSGSIGYSQMCIITGPNIDIATKLIRRLKNILITKRPY